MNQDKAREGNKNCMAFAKGEHSSLLDLKSPWLNISKVEDSVRGKKKKKRVS